MTDATLSTTTVRPEATLQPSRAKCETAIQAGVGLSLAAALFVGYLSLFHQGDSAKFALLAAVALAMGGAIGALAGKFADVVFWSGIGVAFGYLAVVRADMFDWTGLYAWPIVGGMVGIAAALCRDGRPILRMTCCMLVALGLVSVYTFSLFGFRSDLFADLVCAAIGGALMGLGVDLVRRFQTHASVPRHCLAMELITAAILCHAMAIHYLPWL